MQRTLLMGIALFVCSAPKIQASERKTHATEHKRKMRPLTPLTIQVPPVVTAPVMTAGQYYRPGIATLQAKAKAFGYRLSPEQEQQIKDLSPSFFVGRLLPFAPRGENLNAMVEEAYMQIFKGKSVDEALVRAQRYSAI